MTTSNVNGDSFGDEIEVLCDRFEAEWKSGAQPQIERYLAEAPEAARPELVRELLKLDIHYRRDRGDTILPDDYKLDYPEHGGLIDKMLGPSLLPSLRTEIFIAPIDDSDKRDDCHKQFDIPPGQTTVGGSADANIVLSHPTISCVHALFQREGRVVWLTDLNSINGTYVNERRLESNQRVMLYLGDRIRFGSRWLMSEIYLSMDSSEFRANDSDWCFNIPAGQTTVGRSADANIVLSRPGISRTHARFQREGSVLWLTDLNSTNGTYVNERRLESNQRVMLDPGDRIRFGNHSFYPDLPEFLIHGNGMTNLILEDDEPDVPSTNDAGRSVPPAESRSPLAEQGYVGIHRSMESDWHPGDLIENRWEVQ